MISCDSQNQSLSNRSRRTLDSLARAVDADPATGLYLFMESKSRLLSDLDSEAVQAIEAAISQFSTSSHDRQASLKMTDVIREELASRNISAHKVRDISNLFKWAVSSSEKHSNRSRRRLSEV